LAKHFALNGLNSKKELSSRLYSEKTDLYEHYIRQDYKIPQKAKDILGESDKVYKNGEGRWGIGNGAYNTHHKLLRQSWYRTQTKLVGRNRINEIMHASSKKV